MRYLYVASDNVHNDHIAKLISLASPQDLEVGVGVHFNNWIRRNKWVTNYFWKGLREKVDTLKDYF